MVNHNSGSVYPVSDGSCNIVATGFDHQTVTVPVTIRGTQYQTRPRWMRPEAGGTLGIFDLGSLQGSSSFSGDTVRLSSVGAIRAFNLVSSRPWNGAYPGITENCGGNLELTGFPSRTNALTIAMSSRNDVSCTMTLTDGGHPPATITLHFEENVPDPIAGPSLTLTNASQFAHFTARQPGFQPEIQEGKAYCNASQVSWSGPDANGTFEIQPVANGTCTIGVGGWAGGTGIATLKVTVAVPAPSLADGGALAGTSTFAEATGKRPATATLESTDAYRDIVVAAPPGDLQLQVGNVQTGGFEAGLNRFTVSPQHNGLCRLRVSGFSGTSTALDVLVAVPPPVLSKRSIVFSSLRDEGTTVVSEPSVKLGGFGLSDTCANVATVSDPDVYGTIFVTPTAKGHCSLTVTGFDGQTATATVSVHT